MEWIPLTEAAKVWNRADSTLRWAIRNGKLRPDDVKKFGHIWAVKPEAMIREYGETEKYFLEAPK